MVYALTSLIGIPLCALTVITWGQYEVYGIKFLLNKSGLIKNNAQKAPPTTEPKPDDAKEEVDNIALQPDAESQKPSEPALQPRPSSADLSSSIVVFLVGVGLLILYMLLGAIIFNQVVSKYHYWSYGDSLYFVFTSLTTIGFGDLVPVGAVYFNCSFIYIMIGLSMVAMVVILFMEAWRAITSSI